MMIGRYRWLGFIWVLAGCTAVEPWIGNFNLIPVSEEKQLGGQIANEIATQMPLIQGTPANREIEALGRQLVNVLGAQPFDYHFYIVEDPSPNAFTTPGANIYLHTGLFSFADDGNQLAGVLAHEIAHAHARHPTQALSRSLGVDFLVKLVFNQNQGSAAAKQQAQRQIQHMALQLAKGSALSRYSRADESEADEMAYDILRGAGMRTDGLLRFLTKLQQVYQGGAPLPFLRSHPPTPDRIARLQTLENAGSVRPSPFTSGR